MEELPPALCAAWDRALFDLAPDVDRSLLRVVANVIVGRAGAAGLGSLIDALDAEVTFVLEHGRFDYGAQLELVANVVLSEQARIVFDAEADADIYLHRMFGMKTPRPLDVRVPRVAFYLANPDAYQAEGLNCYEVRRRIKAVARSA